MRAIFVIWVLSAQLILCTAGCENVSEEAPATIVIPSFNHDLSYIPFDPEYDEVNYEICDSARINSGRNRIQYKGGSEKLSADILSNYVIKEEYKNFTGFIIIRFLVNCHGLSGRYRAQALHLDFSHSTAPSDLLENVVDIVSGLQQWTRRPGDDPTNEYSKFINLKFENGEIQNVLL